MEDKKNPDKDLNSKSGQFFLIGLSISVSIMITAFEWQTEIIEIPFDPQPHDEATILPEIPIIKIESSKPQKIAPIKQKVISQSFTPIPGADELLKNDVETIPTINVDSLSFNPPTFIVTDVPEADTSYYIFVEENPEPINGYKSFYNDISLRTKYPAQARRMEVEGKVFIEFIINRKGTPTELKVVKGIGAGCDEEAMRVLALSNWRPGKQRGQPVRVKMILPVTFKLGQ